jgi:hypothetical protein
MTPQEVKLWVRLRELRQQGYHFLRQAPKGRYIVDFVCLKSRLIIEVDGAQHGFDSHVSRDTKRDSYLPTADFARCASGTTRSIGTWTASSRQSGMHCKILRSDGISGRH